MTSDGTPDHPDRDESPIRYEDIEPRWDDPHPPPPGSAAWDEWADRILETTEFDTDLGKDLARAAFEVAAGRLDPTEFHDRYHDAVVDEFGLDYRPTDPEGNRDATSAGSNGGSQGNGTREPEGAYDRRAVIKTALATAGLLTVGSAAGYAMDATGRDFISPAAGMPDNGSGVQMGMAIDMERCIACLLCVEACKTENNTSNGANWMHVFRFSETPDDEMDGAMPRPCQHCTNPSCTVVCPTQARFKRAEDGIVLTDYDLCIGCRYCEVGCPYGVNYFEWGDPDNLAGGFPHPRTDRNDRRVAGNPPKGIMGKCTFCVHRQDAPGQAGSTACEEICPVDALHFGDMNDPESPPNQHIQSKPRAARFNLLEEQGTEPNIVYLGNKPSMRARPVDGPFTYEELGIRKRRDRHNVYERGENA